MEGMHLMYENLATLDELRKRHACLMQGTTALKEEIIKFKNDITCKVDAVLARTPLTIRPKKTPTNIDSEDPNCQSLPPPITPQILTPNPDGIKDRSVLSENKSLSRKADLLLKETTPQLSSQGYHSSSPVHGFNSSGLTTPDDIFAAQESLSFVQGLTSVNYDIDLSDLSAENSSADDFGSHNTSKSNVILPLETKLSEESASSLLDSTESPTGGLLPSPIKPVLSGEYHGFSTQGLQIPSIPCHTGDTMVVLPEPQSLASSELARESKPPVRNEKVNTNVQDESQVQSRQNSSQVEETLVKALSEVMNTFDKLF